VQFRLMMVGAIGSDDGRCDPLIVVGAITPDCCSNVRIGCGTSDESASQFGSRRTTAPSTFVMSSPSKARRPVNISYSTQPNA